MNFLFFIFNYRFILTSDTIEVFDDIKAINDLQTNIAIIKDQHKKIVEMNPKITDESTYLKIENNEAIKDTIPSIYINIKNLKYVAKEIIVNIQKGSPIKRSDVTSETNLIHIMREGIFLLNLTLINLNQLLCVFLRLRDISMFYSENHEAQVYIYPISSILSTAELLYKENLDGFSKIVNIFDTIYKEANIVHSMCKNMQKDLKKRYIPLWKEVNTSLHTPLNTKHKMMVIEAIMKVHSLSNKKELMVFPFLTICYKHLLKILKIPCEEINIVRQLEEDKYYFSHFSFTSFHEYFRKTKSPPTGKTEKIVETDSKNPQLSKLIIGEIQKRADMKQINGSE